MKRSSQPRSACDDFSPLQNTLENTKVPTEKISAVARDRGGSGDQKLWQCKGEQCRVFFVLTERVDRGSRPQLQFRDLNTKCQLC